MSSDRPAVLLDKDVCNNGEGATEQDETLNRRSFISSPIIIWKAK